MDWTGALGTSDSGLSELALGVAGEPEAGGVSVDAGLASGAGSALNASIRVSPNAGLAAGTGAANDATVSVSADVSVNAGLAAGTGSALGATPSIAPQAGLAAGTGSALAAAPSVRVNAGLASGAGAANNATVSTSSLVFAGVATGTGAAANPRTAVATHAGTRNGVGAAHNAAVFAEDDYDALPEGDIATGYMPPLAASIDDNDTTATVTLPPTTPPDVPFVVAIDDEEILVTSVVGTTWTLERGYNGTTASAHGSGTIARPALVNIRVDGVLISPDVDYRRSRFTTAANGQPGTAEIWVRDLDRTHAFVTGAEVRVSFRGILMWGGYLASIRREYVFAAGTGNVGDEPRYLLLDCVDYNVLFNKRVFYKFSDPAHMEVKHWPNGTWDSVVISDLVNDHLNISADNLKFDIQHVGTPALPQISCNPDAPDRFGIGSAGWTWGEVMTAITSQTGAVYYIDPDKTFRYVDDSVKQSRFGWDGVSDAPNGTSTIGYRDVEFTSDGTRLRNDHFQWGAGQGSANMVFHRSTAPSSMAEHGLWQSAEVRYDMYCQESVNLRAQSWIYGSPQNKRGGKDDRFFSRVTVHEPYFRVADVISLVCGEFGLNTTAPVRMAEITFPTPWDITCVLTISHELDPPWATFEFWIPNFNFELPPFGGFPGIPPFPDIPGFPAFDPCASRSGSAVCVDRFERIEPDGWGISDISRGIIRFEDDYSRASMGANYTWAATEPSIAGGFVNIVGEHDGEIPGLDVTGDTLVQFDIVTPSSGYAYWEFSYGNRGVAVDIDDGGYGFVYVGNVATDSGTDISSFFVQGAAYKVKAEMDSASGTISRAKVWPADDPEPFNWDRERTSVAAPSDPNATLYFIAENPAYFDNLLVTDANTWVVTEGGPTDVDGTHGVADNDFAQSIDLRFLEGTVEVVVTGAWQVGSYPIFDQRFVSVAILDEDDALLGDAQLHQLFVPGTPGFSEDIAEAWIRVGREPGGSNYTADEPVNYMGYTGWQVRLVVTPTYAFMAAGTGTATISTGSGVLGRAARLVISGGANQLTDVQFMSIDEVRIMRGLDCGTIGEAMGLLGSGSTFDDFNRTEADWGTASGGAVYSVGSPNSNSVAFTDGQNGVLAPAVTSSNADATMAFISGISSTDDFSVSILLSFSGDDLDTRIEFAIGGMLFGRNYGDEPTPYVYISNASGQTNGFVPQELGTPTVFHLRFQRLDGEANLRYWVGGDPEPTDWQVTTDPTVATLDEYVYFGYRTSLGTGDAYVKVDDISFSTLDHCADGAAGEFGDPPMGGPSTGAEPRSRDTEIGPNGGVVYHTQNQFQVGSTEVWVSGLRIRIGIDYIEYPRQAMIEILDHIDVGTDVAPLPVRFNYVVWTIDDPVLE